jgi:hypothetical protein
LAVTTGKETANKFAVFASQINTDASQAQHDNWGGFAFCMTKEWIATPASGLAMTMGGGLRLA